MRGSLFTVIIGQAAAFVNPEHICFADLPLAKHSGIVYSVVYMKYLPQDIAVM